VGGGGQICYKVRPTPFRFPLYGFLRLGPRRVADGDAGPGAGWAQAAL
jgi:hypothetical protein